VKKYSNNILFNFASPLDSEENVEKQFERRQRFCVRLDLNHHFGYKKTYPDLLLQIHTLSGSARNNELKDWKQCRLGLTLEPVKPIALCLYLFDEVAGRHVALRPLDDLFRQLANHNPPAHSLG
jgi:hypothetical protein